MAVPQVSVIIPTYNRRERLVASIQSVLSQTFSNFELIVIDDGSTDDTEEAINEIDDNRLRYIRHDSNKGGAAARNTGIANAKADLIAFQDSDDIWFPEKLSRQINVMDRASDDIGVVYTAFWYVHGEDKKLVPPENVVLRSGNIHDELLKGNFVTTQATLVKRECFDRVGTFSEDLPRLQDWELFLRISKYYKFLIVDQPLLTAYYTADSITADKQAWAVAFKRLLETHRGEFIGNKDVLAGHYLLLAEEFQRMNDQASYRRFLIKAFKENPSGCFLKLFRKCLGH